MGNRNRTNPFEARRKQLERRLVAVEREMQDSEANDSEFESLGAKVWRMIKERRKSGADRPSDGGRRGSSSGRGGTLRISAESVRGDEAPQERQTREKRFSLSSKEVSLAGDALGLGQSLLVGAMGNGGARTRNEGRNRIVANILVIVFFMIAFWMFFTGRGN